MTKSVIVKPVKIDHETEKAVLVFSHCDPLWLPKTQIVILRNCVVSVASWLFLKNKNCFRRSVCTTVEELEQWWDMEDRIAAMMKDDPTIQRCEHCGHLFRSEKHLRLCENCDIDHTINLQHTIHTGGGAINRDQLREAALRGLVAIPKW